MLTALSQSGPALDTLATLNAAAAVATALGVVFTGVQVLRGRRQAVTDFEDHLAREYRTLAATLPIEALLSGSLTEKELNDELDKFYHYFDLCNSQVFLRQIGRVRWRTFEFWRDGIKSNIERPAFAQAWDKISQRAQKDFHELRQLISEDYQKDPRWRKWRCFSRKSVRIEGGVQ